MHLGFEEYKYSKNLKELNWEYFLLTGVKTMVQ